MIRTRLYSLGGMDKEKDEIKAEFGITNLKTWEITGNYRSTQQLIDYYLNFQDKGISIRSLTKYANENGLITFTNQTCSQDDLPHLIANFIHFHLDSGVKDHEICVVAPQWWIITSLGKKLVSLLQELKSIFIS